MSLQKTVTTRSGISLTDAYHKVTNLKWSAAGDAQLMFDVCTYPSSVEADAGQEPADKKQYSMDSFDKSHVDNAHKQVYAWLKDAANGAGFDTGTTDV
jgi:hypothetical protein